MEDLFDPREIRSIHLIMRFQGYFTKQYALVALLPIASLPIASHIDKDCKSNSKVSLLRYSTEEHVNTNRYRRCLTEFHCTNCVP